MELFENKVGRPSNEILKKRKAFIASIAIAVFVVIIIGVYSLSNLNLINLNGASYGNISITKNSVDAKQFNNNNKYPWSKKTGRDWPLFVKRMEPYLTYVAEAAHKYSVDPALIMGVIMMESHANTNNANSCCCGLMAVGYKWVKPSCNELKQPRVGIAEGTKILRDKLKKYNETQALCGYLQGNNPTKTCEYAKKVLEFKGIINKLYTIKRNSAAQKTNTTKTTTKTTVKTTTKLALTAGREIKLTSFKVYITATSKLGVKRTGTYYIYKNSSVKNGRIRISRKKGGVSTGWVEVDQISIVK